MDITASIQTHFASGRRLLGVLFCSIAIALTGCNSIPLLSGPKEPLPPSRADEMETSDVQLHDSDLSGDPLYVVMGIDVLTRDQLNIREELLEGILKTLSDNWVRVDVQRQRSNAQFRQEIERSLANSSSGGYQGAQKVNYLLFGRLELSTFVQRFEGPSLLCTSWSDDCPGSCEYEMKASLSLESESLPQKRRSRKWVLQSTASRTFDAEKRCPNPNSVGEASQIYRELREDVVSDLLDCSERPLEDYFSPRGFVLDYLSDGKRFLFEISAGAAAGFSEGDTVLVEKTGTAARSGNDLISEGEITRVTEKRSFVSVPSQFVANQIRIHDQVRLKQSRYIPSLACNFVLDEK